VINQVLCIKACLVTCQQIRQLFHFKILTFLPRSHAPMLPLKQVPRSDSRCPKVSYGAGEGLYE
jgi:hypothetical protein